MMPKLYKLISVISAMIGIYNAILYNMDIIDLSFLALIALTLYYIEKDYFKAKKFTNVNIDAYNKI